MMVTPRVVHRLRGRTSGADLDTEGGRAFLQERIALFNKVAFCISGVFLVVATLAIVDRLPASLKADSFLKLVFHDKQ